MVTTMKVCGKMIIKMVKENIKTKIKGSLMKESSKTICDMDSEYTGTIMETDMRVSLRKGSKMAMEFTIKTKAIVEIIMKCT